MLYKWGKIKKIQKKTRKKLYIMSDSVRVVATGSVAHWLTASVATTLTLSPIIYTLIRASEPMSHCQQGLIRRGGCSPAVSSIISLD